MKFTCENVKKNKIVAEHSPAFALFQLEGDGKVLSIDLTHVLGPCFKYHVYSAHEFDRQ